MDVPINPITNQTAVPEPEVKTIPKPKNWLIILFLILFLISIGLVGFLFYQNSIVKKQSTQVLPQPEQISLPTPIVTVDNIEQFFDEQKSSDRIVQYLQTSKLIKSEEMINISCQTYISDFIHNEGTINEKDSIYVSISAFTSSSGNIDGNIDVEKYQLKDKTLESVINSQNSLLQKKDSDIRIRRIAQCVIPHRQILIVYDLNKTSSSHYGYDNGLYIGFLGNNNQLVNVARISKGSGLLQGYFECNQTPVVITDKETAFFRCWTNDAGTNIVYVYSVNLENNEIEEILECTSNRELGHSPPPVEYKCEIPS